MPNPLYMLLLPEFLGPKSLRRSPLTLRGRDLYYPVPPLLLQPNSNSWKWPKAARTGALHPARYAPRRLHAVRFAHFPAAAAHCKVRAILTLPSGLSIPSAVARALHPPTWRGPASRRVLRTSSRPALPASPRLAARPPWPPPAAAPTRARRRPRTEEQGSRGAGAAWIRCGPLQLGRELARRGGRHGPARKGGRRRGEEGRRAAGEQGPRGQPLPPRAWARRRGR